ncbi:MAG: AAA family ATPase [Gammaproteobacteria bacterium]|nr:AAA family ATPase [Gammaproteobacteria bacterium]MYK46938.1 AAA family ATPase [Gammaproteobacteria bacterium]
MSGVTHLTVRGFKSIKALERFELGSLNVLIGPNGSGKSNLLDVFRMLGAIAAGRLQLFVAGEDKPDALLHRGRNHTDELTVECAFGDQAYRATLTAVGNHMVFMREQTILGGRINGLGSGHYESNLAAPEKADADAVARFLIEAMTEWRVYQFHNTSINAAIRQSQPLRHNLSLHDDGGNLAPFLRFLRERHPESYRQIVQTVRLAAPFFGDFVYREKPGEHVELEWFGRDLGQDHALGPRQLSDGTLRFIALVTLLSQPTQLQPNPILIDEPELGLHPFALVLLAELLEAASLSRQIVVSTQSADLVSEFEAKNIITAGLGSGQSEFDRLDEDRLREWLEEYGLGDLWRMNVVGGSPSR